MNDKFLIQLKSKLNNVNNNIKREYAKVTESNIKISVYGEIRDEYEGLIYDYEIKEGENEN